MKTGHHVLAEGQWNNLETTHDLAPPEYFHSLLTPSDFLNTIHSYATADYEWDNPAPLGLC